jgi:hypothetical protein
VIGRREGKIPLGRPTFKMENKIKIDFKVVEGEGVTWIHLSQDEDQERALVVAVMRLRVLENSGYILTSCRAICFAGGTHWNYVVIYYTLLSENRLTISSTNRRILTLQKLL